MTPDLEDRFIAAVKMFWGVRDAQTERQVAKGNIDAGSRGAVTGGQQMAALESLVEELLVDVGVPRSDIFRSRRLELPGYYRGEKKWDLLVVSDNRLVAALEFKSHIGPSFGNNFNNRTEEAIGNATDIWVAFRERRLGSTTAPFLGFLMLLEDCPGSTRPVGWSQPHFRVDPAFVGASYEMRYKVLLERLLLERLYNGVCLTLSPRPPGTGVRHTTGSQGFRQYMESLLAYIAAWR